MRIVEERYFNINRRLLISIGLWPYDTKRRKYVLRAIIFSVLMVGNLSQLISMFLHRKNTDRLILGTLGFCALLVTSTKMLVMILTQENMKTLHRSIASNWVRIQDSCERDILQEYSERARRATIFYIAVTGTSASIVVISPLIPKILDFLKPLEDPRPSIYLSAAELLVDKETHFFLYFFLDYIEIMLIALVAIAVDTKYIVTVEQCCALYAIARSRLLELKLEPQEKSSGTEDVDSFEWLRHTVEVHQDALIFSSLVNKMYSKLFMFIAISALFIIPFDSCAIIANLDNSLHLIPYVVVLINVMIHGFAICYPGQRVIDHQMSLLDAAYYNEWYATPIRTRRLLLIVMMRCSNPVMITVGDLVPANFPIYFKVMKTSASYITVASSFR